MDRKYVALAAILVACGAYYASKRRAYLSTKMNLMSAFLLDPSAFFPTVPYPRGDPAEALRIARKKRQEWEDTAVTLGKILRLKEVAKVEDIIIPARDSASTQRTIQARVYVPLNPLKSRNDSNNGIPVIMYLHGGGWTVGSIAVYDGFCRVLCQASGCVVVSIEYRLAPEHPFPAGLEDCEDAFKFISSSPPAIQSLGGDCKRLVLAGDSAGGNLAAVLSLMQDKDKKIALQVLIYPALSAFGLPLHREPPFARLPSDSPQRSVFAPVLPLSSLLFLWESYLSGLSGTAPPERLITDPRVSPMCFSKAELAKAPPTYVITADADVLADEGRAFVNKLKEAGVSSVVHRHFLDAVHGFLVLPHCTGQKEAFEDMGAYIREFFSSSS